jgi:glycosyltransferase involved in cell wall biosynthesis
MTSQPVISIVLPTYNGAKYIRTSIESCLSQTFTSFELIIVNDCSTDNTASIIGEYAEKDERIVIIHNNFNKKLPLSLNTGFDIAKGKYHTWTSDDNYYAPQALETLYNELQKEKEADLIYTDYSIIDTNGNITGKRTFNNIYEGFTEWLGCGACFLYKAEVYFKNNGYNPSAFLIEDYDFFMRAFLQFKFLYYRSHDLYFYREHETSLTASHSDMVNYIAKMMIERQMNKLEQKLPKDQLALLYRKLAVFNAVQKNNAYKYSLYLTKLWKLSKKQTAVTLIYVPMLKLWRTITVGLKGFQTVVVLLIKKN